jgi:type IV pilus assembly protein PilW
MNAGFYPATMPPVSTYSPTMQIANGYPPQASTPPSNTDWTAPAPTYLNPIFGCDSSKFDHVTATCGSATAGAPDSIVVNYFNNEAADTGATMGQRFDCRGNDAGNDPSNAIRKLNSGGPPASAMNNSLPPQAPIFVSNRYALNPTDIQVEDKNHTTNSLACGGNGTSFFGTADNNAYQSMILGLEDMQFTYGVFSTSTTRAPDRYYTATEVNGLPNTNIDGVNMTPWQRVVSVKVCIITKTIGNNQSSSYKNCTDDTKTGTGIYKKHIQVFAVRNKLNQGF